MAQTAGYHPQMLQGDVCEFVVIGAGAAGLAAAAELCARGRRVCVLEARDRLGGRILTRLDPASPLPIELGAEFIHGESRSTLDWLARAKVGVLDTGRERWVMKRGELRPGDDSFRRMTRGLRAAGRPSVDLPFDGFLEGRARRHLSPALRFMARSMVQGFDAADATRVSTLETLDEWSGAASADSPTFRPLGGYASLVHALAGALPLEQARVEMGAVVTGIAWERGAVRIEGTQRGMPFVLEAQRAIVTLPLGVLQQPAGTAGAVRFTPELRHKAAAIAGLASGPVVKCVLQFHQPFWERLQGRRFRNAGFFQVPGAPFSVFWTSLPQRSTVLNAWAAGPDAARLAGADAAALTPALIDSLNLLFGPRARARSQLFGLHYHDWQADPFARGAYSYVLAGHGGARRNLARPLQRTLFFAGEASNHEGEAATVGGALHTGKRAAREALRR